MSQQSAEAFVLYVESVYGTTTEKVNKHLKLLNKTEKKSLENGNPPVTPYRT